MFRSEAMNGFPQQLGAVRVVRRQGNAFSAFQNEGTGFGQRHRPSDQILLQERPPPARPAVRLHRLNRKGLRWIQTGSQELRRDILELRKDVSRRGWKLFRCRSEQLIELS